MRLLRAEIQKLARPLMLFVTIGVMLVVVAITGVSQETAALQYKIARQAAELGSRSEIFACKSFGLQAGTRCDRARARLKQDQLDFLKQTTEDAQLPAATQKNIFAAGGFSAGILSSLIGGIAVFLLGAAHIGGEWTGRTAKSWFAEDGRRTRFVFAKAFTLWLASVWLLAWSWAAVVAWNQISQHFYRLPAVQLDLAWSYGGERLLRSLLVLAGFSLLASASSILIRNVLGGLFLATGIMIGSYIAAGFAHVSHATLGYWVAAWMQFRHQPLLIDHVWPDVFPNTVTPDPIIGAAGLTGMILVCVAASMMRMRQSDIGG
jgi:hypothetical protein